MHINKVTLMGYLNTDPLFQKDPQGVPFGLLSLGTNHYRLDPRGHKRTTTTWHRVRVWNERILKTARETLRQGSRVLVEGSLQYARLRKDGEKMTLSLRATLSNHLQGFKYLEDTGEAFAFSVRDWVRDEKSRDGWLFITAMPDQRESLRPFMTAWLDVAISALITLPPCDARRLWFIMDELPALNHIPSLQMGLAEMRKYGGCVLAGIQSVAQINTLYPKSEAQSILDLFNTFAFFRSNDPTTTHWISEMLGKADETKMSENMSFGANAIRDGVSLNKQRTTTTLVIGTQIANLKNLECYLRLPEESPITRLKLPYQNTPRKQAPFTPKEIEVIDEKIVA